MKKILMALTLCIVSVSAFAQLNFGNQGSGIKITSFYKDAFAEICIDNGRYVINCYDVDTKTPFSMILGSTKDEAMMSLEQLEGWCQQAQLKDFVEINQVDGTTVLIYVNTQDQLIMTFGNIDYAKAKFKSLADRSKLKEQLPFGFVMRKAFAKAIEKLKTVK